MPTAAILTISDTRSAGTRTDTTTALMREILEGLGIEVVATRLVPDERDEISGAISELAAGANLVLTSGGTGLAPRDVTPEATLAVLDREAPGIAE
ncbi:MAG: molybdopterin-binding protein, partial [Gemmatimonadaceae bacterium]|nr:molybdopterin-binding protein [Gemmatimonadaceae bacterium]